MRLHEPRAVLANFVRTQKQFGMDQVERADIEAGRHADPASEGDHPLDEVEAGAAEIETAVDMRRLDVEKTLCGDRLGEADDEPHGERRAAAVRAVQKLAIEVDEFQSHSGQASGRGSAGQTRLPRTRPSSTATSAMFEA